MALSLVLFFAYTWGLGFTAAKFLKESDNFLERNLTRIGLGLCVVPLIGIIFSILHIPVDWKIFLILSIIYPAYFLFRNYRNINLKFRLKKSDLSLFLVILVFISTFYMYHKGAFAYPYLEDDDSWSHALGVNYVAYEKTFFAPGARLHYLDPYPPVYDGVLGLLRQNSSSMMWLLKFFNAFIISLSIIFFYLFVKELTNSSSVALSSTIILSMIPAYLSHFIWAHAFIPGFIFLSFLFLERIKYDKRWMYAASLAISAIILTSTTQSIKYAVLFIIYFAVKSVIEKKFFKEIFVAGILGFVLSLTWWIPLGIRYGSFFGLLEGIGLSQNRLNIPLSYYINPYLYIILSALLFLIIAAYYIIKRKLTLIQKNYIGITAAITILVSYLLVYSSVYALGTADRIYDFNDFFVAHKQNLINNPIGIGIVALSLAFLAFFFVLYEQYSGIMQNKYAIPKIQFNALRILILVSFAALLMSML